MKLKVEIIKWLTRRWDMLLVARDENNGCVVVNIDPESEEESKGHLRAILNAAFRNDQAEVKDVILGAAEDWLKGREIETKNFIERIK